MKALFPRMAPLSRLEPVCLFVALAMLVALTACTPARKKNYAVMEASGLPAAEAPAQGDAAKPPQPADANLAPVKPVENNPVTDPVIDAKANPLVAMKTAKGEIVIELFEDQTPNTVANFMYLVATGHYNGSDFHRVEPFSSGATQGRPDLWLAQGGRKGRNESFDWSIQNEGLKPDYTLKNKAGRISMARTNDPHSAGCQFFLNVVDGPAFWDDPRAPYCVFGAVTSSMDVLKALRPGDKIIEAKVTRRRDHDYIPTVRRAGERDYKPAE